MRVLSTTILASILVALAVEIHAAPATKREINLLVEKLVTIDPSCKGKIEETLADAYTIAQVAPRKFTNYFLPGDHIIEFDKTKTFPIDPRHVLNTEMAPNMFRSILSGGANGRKFTAKCPTLSKSPQCWTALTQTTFLAQVDEPTIFFCPRFFTTPETKAHLSDKEFTNGWLPIGRD
ncbi:hypothetical protein BT96DRAFT_1000957 [Gymnopus androsaceus JB14]|uniref:Uncharacterized protein n=1 Tax=Gymnopus androsaceus JB14 TaxID=1447944 RepID=A0A6A4H1B2_9AGAR|nr:hypothetical protein BT96DRAFT_1000957 [Gymnopus androsaceus JB14]